MNIAMPHKLSGSYSVGIQSRKEDCCPPVKVSSENIALAYLRIDAKITFQRRSPVKIYCQYSQASE
ncbi:hypothetical protein OUHCRE11_10730 [Enterobacter asburiae]